MTRRDDLLAELNYAVIESADTQEENARWMAAVEAYVDSDPRVKALDEIREILDPSYFYAGDQYRVAYSRLRLDRLDAETKPQRPGGVLIGEDGVPYIPGFRFLADEQDAEASS